MDIIKLLIYLRMKLLHLSNVSMQLPYFPSLLFSLHGAYASSTLPLSLQMQVSLWPPFSGSNETYGRYFGPGRNTIYHFYRPLFTWASVKRNMLAKRQSII